MRGTILCERVFTDSVTEEPCEVMTRRPIDLIATCISSLKYIKQVLTVYQELYFPTRSAHIVLKDFVVTFTRVTLAIVTRVKEPLLQILQVFQNCRTTRPLK